MKLLSHKLDVYWGCRRYRQIVFNSGCTSLQSHPQCVRVPVALRPHQYLVPSALLVLTILGSVCFIVGLAILVSVYFIVVFMCISLRSNDVENLFIALLAIWIFSFAQCLFRSLVHIFGVVCLFPVHLQGKVLYIWLVWVFCLIYYYKYLLFGLLVHFPNGVLWGPERNFYKIQYINLLWLMIFVPCLINLTQRLGRYS